MTNENGGDGDKSIEIRLDDHIPKVPPVPTAVTVTKKKKRAPKPRPVLPPQRPVIGSIGHSARQLLNERAIEMYSDDESVYLSDNNEEAVDADAPIGKASSTPTPGWSSVFRSQGDKKENQETSKSGEVEPSGKGALVGSSESLEIKSSPLATSEPKIIQSNGGMNSSADEVDKSAAGTGLTAGLAALGASEDIESANINLSRSASSNDKGDAVGENESEPSSKRKQLMICLVILLLLIVAIVVGVVVSRSDPSESSSIAKSPDGTVATVIPTSMSLSPSSNPSSIPSVGPSSFPSLSGSPTTTPLPSTMASASPTFLPTASPSFMPSTAVPSANPSSIPSTLPSSIPSTVPSTALPSAKPSGNPSFLQQTAAPTTSQSWSPTSFPSTTTSSLPSTTAPSVAPSIQASGSPTGQPSSDPSSSPTGAPSIRPTSLPTSVPSASPSGVPVTRSPTSVPSASPSGGTPTRSPTSVPSTSPSRGTPTRGPTVAKELVWINNLTPYFGNNFPSTQLQKEVLSELVSSNIWEPDDPSDSHLWMERFVLSLFYEAARGDGWNLSGGWRKSDTGVCDWFGVSCDSSDRVVSIMSQFNGLGGSLPSEIGLLGELKRLGLQRNQLQGRIPREIGNLVKLELLDLRNNQLSGIVPIEVEDLAASRDTEVLLRGNSVSCRNNIPNLEC